MKKVALSYWCYISRVIIVIINRLDLSKTINVKLSKKNCIMKRNETLPKGHLAQRPPSLNNLSKSSYGGSATKKSSSNENQHA